MQNKVKQKSNQKNNVNNKYLIIEKCDNVEDLNHDLVFLKLKVNYNLEESFEFFHILLDLLFADFFLGEDVLLHSPKYLMTHIIANNLLRS